MLSNDLPIGLLDTDYERTGVEYKQIKYNNIYTE